MTVPVQVGPVRRANRPCSECPWRRDQPAGRSWPERYEALRATAGTPGNEVGLTAPVFACHKSADGKDIACAGWLAVVGAQHLGMRYAAIAGRLPFEAFEPGEDWPDLYSSYEELAQANGASQCRHNKAPPSPALDAEPRGE